MQLVAEADLEISKVWIKIEKYKSRIEWQGKIGFKMKSWSMDQNIRG